MREVVSDVCVSSSITTNTSKRPVIRPVWIFLRKIKEKTKIRKNLYQ